MDLGSIEIKGLDKLTAQLAELPKKTQGQIARPALRAGAKLIQQAAVADAPRKTGLLAKSIKVRAAKRSRKRTGPAVLVTTGQGDSYYAFFEEYGWHVGKRSATLRRAYKINKRKAFAGDKRRMIEGKHFMQRAFDSTKDQAAAVIERQLAAGIEQALKS